MSSINNKLEPGVYNLPITSEELEDTVDALQHSINITRHFIAQGAFDGNEQMNQLRKLMKTEAVLKRLLKLISIGEPPTDTPQ